MTKTILMDDENFNCFVDPDCFTHLSEQMTSDDKWAYVGYIDTEKTLVSTKYFVNRYGEWKTERNTKSGRSFKIHNPSSKFVLTENTKQKRYGNYVYCTVGSVHRLVAKAFLPNPDNLPEVDHIDGNPANNNVSNLRWVTRS